MSINGHSASHLELPRFTRNWSWAGQSPDLQGAQRMILRQGRKPTPRSRPRNAWFVELGIRLWQTSGGQAVLRCRLHHAKSVRGRRSMSTVFANYLVTDLYLQPRITSNYLDLPRIASDRCDHPHVRIPQRLDIDRAG